MAYKDVTHCFQAKGRGHRAQGIISFHKGGFSKSAIILLLALSII
jgi:hypothetical protein